MPPGPARPRSGAARPWDEPARRDCRQSPMPATSTPCPVRPVGRPAWVIIGTLVSLSRKRLVATLVALLASAGASLAVLGAAPPPSTWVALTPLPQQGHAAILALGVS